MQKISKLIKKLEKIRQKHGDIEACIIDGDTGLAYEGFHIRVRDVEAFSLKKHAWVMTGEKVADLFIVDPEED